MFDLIIGIIGLAIGVFVGYRVGLTPGTGFIEKAKGYFSGTNSPPPPPTGTAV
jgi:hypothetical protein